MSRMREYECANCIIHMCPESPQLRELANDFGQAAAEASRKLSAIFFFYIFYKENATHAEYTILSLFFSRRSEKNRQVSLLSDTGLAVNTRVYDAGRGRLILLPAIRNIRHNKTYAKISRI